MGLRNVAVESGMLFLVRFAFDDVPNGLTATRFVQILFISLKFRAVFFASPPGEGPVFLLLLLLPLPSSSLLLLPLPPPIFLLLLFLPPSPPSSSLLLAPPRLPPRSSSRQDVGRSKTTGDRDLHPRSWAQNAPRGLGRRLKLEFFFVGPNALRPSVIVCWARTLSDLV